MANDGGFVDLEKVEKQVERRVRMEAEINSMKLEMAGFRRDMGNMQTHFTDEVGNLRDGVKEDMEKLQKSIAGLVKAWDTANGLVRAVKLLGALAIAVGAIWALAKGHEPPHAG